MKISDRSFIFGKSGVNLAAIQRLSRRGCHSWFDLIPACIVLSCRWKASYIQNYMSKLGIFLVQHSDLFMGAGMRMIFHLNLL